MGAPATGLAIEPPIPVAPSIEAHVSWPCSIDRRLLAIARRHRVSIDNDDDGAARHGSGFCSVSADSTRTDLTGDASCTRFLRLFSRSRSAHYYHSGRNDLPQT